MNKNKYSYVLYLIIVFIVVIVLVAVGIKIQKTVNAKKTMQSTNDLGPKKAALTVSTTQVIEQKIPRTIVSNGGIYPWQQIIIGSEVGGLVINDVQVDIGEYVQKGQLLASLNTDSLQADLTLQQANVASAKVALLQAQDNAKRGADLIKNNGISKQQEEQYYYAEKTAQSALDAAMATLTNVQIKLKHASIIAPDDGVITSRSAVMGSIVEVGTELFKMTRKGLLEWRAEVTPLQMSQIKKGQQADIILSKNNFIKGSVRNKAPTIDQNTRKGLVYIDLPKVTNTQTELIEGLFVSGTIQLGEKQATLLPQSAITYRDGFAYVFIIGDNNKVIQKKVIIGTIIGDQVEIISPSLKGLKLVQSGGGFLNQDDLVTVVPDPAIDKTKTTKNKIDNQEEK